MTTGGSEARSRALAAVASIALAGLAGGCAGATTTGSTVTGSTLSIYTHQQPGDLAGQDVVDAEQLALQQAGQAVGRYKIAFKVLHSKKISDDARTAIKDDTTVAYLGELTPHSSADSIGITNGRGVLQVSPTDSALELTHATIAVPGAPDRYYQNLPTYHHTFGRVVPTSDTEAAALVKVMQKQLSHKLYVFDDGSLYGRAIAVAAIAAARTAGLAVATPLPGRPDLAKIKASGADSVFAGADVGGTSSTARLFDAVAAAIPRIKLYAPAPLDSQLFALALGPAAERVTTVSAPGFLDAGLTQAGRKFAVDFLHAYHRRPLREAIFGYEAMAVVLDSLRRAGTAAGTRSEVVRNFLRTTNRTSVLGTYSINASTGDIQNVAPYVISHVRGGRFVAYEAVQG